MFLSMTSCGFEKSNMMFVTHSTKRLKLKQKLYLGVDVLCWLRWSTGPVPNLLYLIKTPTCVKQGPGLKILIPVIISQFKQKCNPATIYIICESKLQQHLKQTMSCTGWKVYNGSSSSSSAYIIVYLLISLKAQAMLLFVLQWVRHSTEYVYGIWLTKCCTTCCPSTGATHRKQQLQPKKQQL